MANNEKQRKQWRHRKRNESGENKMELALQQSGVMRSMAKMANNGVAAAGVANGGKAP
jgi:hypothetical protein